MEAHARRKLALACPKHPLITGQPTDAAVSVSSNTAEETVRRSLLQTLQGEAQAALETLRDAGLRSEAEQLHSLYHASDHAPVPGMPTFVELQWVEDADV
jgi:hypothetical protein